MFDYRRLPLSRIHVITSEVMRGQSRKHDAKKCTVERPEYQEKHQKDLIMMRKQYFHRNHWGCGASDCISSGTALKKTSCGSYGCVVNTTTMSRTICIALW